MTPRRAACLLLSTLLAGKIVSAQLPAGTADASSSSSTTTHADPIEERLQAEASTALDRQDYPAALTALKSLVARHPDDPHLRFNLASTEDALDQNTAAEADYRQAATADPAYLEPHLALGLMLARTNHTAEAQTELAAATAITTGAPALRARAYRALAHLDATSQPTAAGDALLSAIKLSPETPDDSLLAAQLAAGSGDPASAEAAYRRFLASTPNDPTATAALAQILLRSNKTAEAEASLNAALAAHAGDPVLSAQLAEIYDRQGDRPRALALVEPLHAAHPDEASLTGLYARLLAETGDYAAAEPLFARARQQSPADCGLADDDADALIHLKRFAEAEQVLKPVVVSANGFSSPESFAGAASHLAFAASQNNDPQTVLRALSLRATVLPQSPATLFLEAIARDRLHQLKEAKTLYQQFLSTAGGKFPDEEWEARHRLLALEHTH